MAWDSFLKRRQSRALTGDTENSSPAEASLPGAGGRGLSRGGRSLGSSEFKRQVPLPPEVS